MRHFLAIVGLIAVSHAALARPAEFIIIRHGEKPPNDDIPGLSARGWQRANALPSLFTTNGPFASNSPGAIFAAKPTSHGRSIRAELTVRPLSQAVHLPIQTPFEAADFKRLAHFLLHNQRLDGKTVIIAWVHDYIPQLASALGAHSPPRWKGSDYDHAWLLKEENGAMVLRVVPEHLLPGDSKR